MGFEAQIQETRVWPVLARDKVEKLIANGHKIVIFHQFVLKIDPWLPYHPGGEKALLHMVGKDATDEIQALHSQDAQAQMMRYRIGTINGVWSNFTPPIQGGEYRSLEGADEPDEPITCGPSGQQSKTECGPRSSRSPESDLNQHGPATQHMSSGLASTASSRSPHPNVGTDASLMSYLDALTLERISIDNDKYPAVDVFTQRNIALKYRALHRKIVQQGLYECGRMAYIMDICRCAGLFSAMLLLLFHGYYTLSAVCLGATWHQLVFLAHDAGHMGITHDFQIDTVIGILVADFIGGLSLGWWKRSHNIHHIVTNAPEHDPDIEHMPLFAVSHRFLSNLRSSYYDRLMKYDAIAKIMLRIQPWTYYPLLALGRFNLYRLSWDHLIARRGPRHGAGAWHWYLELAGQFCFWLWFGYGILYLMLPNLLTRLMFVLVSHVTSSPLHVQIVLSHFAMSTSDLGPQESFAQRMLRTTMDVDCPPWLDFIHGGLQFQVIHHLFPRVPRHNLRKTQRLVIEFCKDVGIPYALYGFSDGNHAVIGRLAEVSRQASILAKCQQTVARRGNVFADDRHL
ncbi:hypothetical protein E4U42_002594 [Claviceps africana]|uniref:Delta 8-(E)-sphingolipid desaturase n=1 Tax=Claviceps africana TaxID=83212 RepID=A0A8K0J8J3_9HYPO|nr:hypothetical protein E4U42_002594 [Claviceps africana]